MSGRWVRIEPVDSGATPEISATDTCNPPHATYDTHVAAYAPQGTDEAGAAPEYNDTNPDLDDMR